MRPIAPRALRRTTGGLAALLLALTACSDRSPVEPRLEPSLSPGAAAASLDATPAGFIRVGVVPAATTVRLGSDAGFTLRNKATGAVLLGGGPGEVSVGLGDNVVVHSHYRLQTAWTTSVAYRDDWVARATAAGYPVYLEDYNGGWRLFIGEFATNAAWGVRNAFRNEVIALGLAAGDSFWKVVTFSEGTVQYEISHAGGVVTSPDQVVLESSDGVVRIDGKPYRGRAEVRVNGQGTLAGINELPLEEYLYGVVPRELPPVPYGEPEAQKAQAVAARTYAYANLGKRRADGYDLLPTTSDQVYGGMEAEHPVSSAAVDATAGVVAVYGDDYAATLFHSTSGGFTANNEDVYASAPIAYLRGVPDAQRGQALEHVPSLEVFKRHANPTNLRAHAGGDFEADWSRYHRWTVSWSRAEMAQALTQGFGTTVTEVDSIRVTDRAELGRVREIRFWTDAGELVGVEDGIRTRLPYPTATGALSSLRSTLFYLEAEVDPRTKAVTGWTAFGGGWGHGVGMSQTGAVGMAEKGADYAEILRHYYRGIELETR